MGMIFFEGYESMGLGVDFSQGPQAGGLAQWLSAAILNNHQTHSYRKAAEAPQLVQWKSEESCRLLHLLA